jgi:hypothetical protein
MDQAQARALLAGERARLHQLLQVETGEPQPAELGDEVDIATVGAHRRLSGPRLRTRSRA